MRILVSACLMGVGCRYDGKSNQLPQLEQLMKQHTCIPVCPEMLGGLPSPRKPVEWRDGHAVTRDGDDWTAEFRLGVARAMALIGDRPIDLAILQSRSPTCGVKQVYDGTFSGRLCDGDGVCGALLQQHGIKVLGESRVQELLEEGK